MKNYSELLEQEDEATAFKDAAENVRIQIRLIVITGILAVITLIMFSILKPTDNEKTNHPKPAGSYSIPAYGQKKA